MQDIQVIESHMSKCFLALQDNLSKLRAGRAHPAVLDRVRVDSYGSEMPLSQVANISIEGPQTLVVNVWDKENVAAVEKAIMNADLGMNPNTAGTVIRLPVPALTEERRRDLLKLVNAEGEKARITLRQVRRDANQEVKEGVKQKLLSEDEEKRALVSIQTLTDQYIAKIDTLLAEKEKDILQV